MSSPARNLTRPERTTGPAEMSSVLSISLSSMTPSVEPDRRNWAAISGLSAARERENRLSKAAPQQRIVEVDKILQKILNGLFKELQNIFRQLATDTPPLLDYVNTVYAQSQHISSELEAVQSYIAVEYCTPASSPTTRRVAGHQSRPSSSSSSSSELESEITGVEMTYNMIPGARRQRRMFTKYHEFLLADGSNIRYLVEQFAILHDHLEILQRYFRWYSDGPIIIEDAKNAPVPTPVELFKLDDELVERVYAAFWDTRYAPIPPRRLTAVYPSLPFNSDYPSSASQ
ncbi:uncharacterized protein ARMOST_14447 [Armillaria ostoyae]|uniref:Uncharacterized protein n=1 Tax=Armillaria ostoyae TaxID=47428 RepID=A0A284RQJ2_ARMOS|nr:uncharacterized protein ARMOST_14447 [Armillaria ostoyae]